VRIAMISEHASPLAEPGDEAAGGQNVHVAELSTALVASGHEVRVYTRRDAPGLPDRVSAAGGFTVVHVPAGPAAPVARDELLPYMKDFGHWLAATWREDGWRPDVVHAHFWMSGVAAVTARRQFEVPIVQTYHALGTVKRRHQGAADPSPRERIGYERALGHAVDRVVAQCRDEIAELRRMGVPPDKVALVPSGVDTDRFCPTGPATARVPGRPRVLAVGRLVARKGFHELVRALRAVPDAECVVVGGPPADRLDSHPLARELRDLAESCRVSQRLKLVGAVAPQAMPAWYRSADLFAATPWYEPFGLAPLEAMACGVPVVASAVGGLTDTVVDGVTGLLVPPRDPRALGTTVRRLLRDGQRRFAYGVAAVDRAKEGYSWSRAVARLTAVYQAVSRHRPGIRASEMTGEMAAETTGEVVA